MSLPSRQAFLLLRLLLVMQAYRRLVFLLLLLQESSKRRRETSPLSTDETLTLPYYVRGVKDFPIDLNRDGSITEDEVIDLAITSQRGGVVIHQVTPEGGLNRLDFIHLNGMSKESGGGDLCVDRRRRLLYIGGVKLSTGENGLYVISLYDLPRPGEAALGVYGTKILDENKDGRDDRVIGFIPNAGGCNAVNDDATVAYNTQGGVQTVRLAPDPLEIKHVAYDGVEKVAGLVRRFNGMRESEYFLEADMAEPAHAYLKKDGKTGFTVTVDVRGGKGELITKPWGVGYGALSRQATLYAPHEGCYSAGQGGHCYYRSRPREDDGSPKSPLLIFTDLAEEAEALGVREEGRGYEKKRGWEGEDLYLGDTLQAMYAGLKGRKVKLTVDDETLWRKMVGEQYWDPKKQPRETPIERMEIVVLGIDGLRQDVLYDSLEEQVQDPNGDFYVTLWDLAGIGQVLGGIRNASGNGVDDVREERFIKLQNVTSVFPSITLASWASIFTGELPGKKSDADVGTGQLGNEFFARDLLGQPGVPAGLGAPSGVVSYSSGSFPGYDTSLAELLKEFVPWGSLEEGADPWKTSQNRLLHKPPGTVYEWISEKGGRAVVVGNHYARGADLWLTQDAWAALTSVGASVPNIFNIGAASGAMDRVSKSMALRWLDKKKRDFLSGSPFPDLFVYYTGGVDHCPPQ